MTRLRTDHEKLKRQAMELWRQKTELRRRFVQVDREIVNLRNAWAGDDELHFCARWQELRAQSSVLQRTEHGISVFAEHLISAAKIYREAQTDAINAARDLLQ